MEAGPAFHVKFVPGATSPSMDIALTSGFQVVRTTWNPDVKAISIEGDVAPGTNFTWKAGPASIASTIQRVERPWLIAWTGKTFGMSAIHVFRLDARDGGTVVHTEESFEGWLARLLRGQMRKTLQNSLHSGLRHLKTRVQRAGT